MTLYTTIKNNRRVLIPLEVKPSHQEIPSFTSTITSHQAGTLLIGHYSMDYRLPGGDFLRLLANHDQKTVQILLLTSQPEKLKNLPGKRPSSLIAQTISTINRYCILSESYSKPKTTAQQRKFEIAQESIHQLSTLLRHERSLLASDWEGQETLRRDVISIIETCRDKNRLIAINPTLSEGALGNILYESHQAAQHYEFNRVFPVSRIDQLDFSQMESEETEKKTCFIWDSKIHIGHDESALNDAIRVISQHYGLNPAKELSNIPANRFKRLEQFFYNRWQDGHDWFNHLATRENVEHRFTNDSLADGLSISRIKPYYHFDGMHQQGYDDCSRMVCQLTGTLQSGLMADTEEEALRLLGSKANGHWVQINNPSCLIVRYADEMTRLQYFEEDGLFYPLPSGQDLFTLSQLSKKHLYLPERLQLQLRAFFSHLPKFVMHAYSSLKQFISHDLYDDFSQHIHQDHIPAKEEELAENTTEAHQQAIQRSLYSLQELLEGQGLLSNGQSLKEFVAKTIAEKKYVIVREQHPGSPPAYDNPLHRSVQVLRHIAGFFVDTNERNPIIGSLALAAYAYGAGAVLAPQALAALLTKLHLHGLISAIPPTQALGHWMSHGSTSEAISSAMTYWQAIIIGGQFDKFFINAVNVLQDDPAEVAIIVALAMGLGYGLCKTFPSLEKEMGEFPYLNYLALGAKGGAAIYDTVMHPGEDWLLGTMKWLLKTGLSIGKILIGPFIEGYYYGYSNGFLKGVQKSFWLSLRSIRQIVAALLDLILTIATIPFLEVSALLLHVPFRGITNLAAKLLGAMGHWQDLGQSLLYVAQRPTSWYFLPGYRLSPLYGFHNPLGHYSSIRGLNILCNLSMCLLLPPLELVKNLLLLPLIDSLSLILRIGLTLLNPLSRVLALLIGTALTTSGFFWDNSVGYLFRGTAFLLISSANWFDGEAGELKQTCLGLIQLCRRALFDWAFADEDRLVHQCNNDNQYFLDKPMRMEQLPHDTTDCLFQALFINTQEAMETRPEPPRHYPPLFTREKESEDDALFRQESYYPV